jgi:molecular chaperone DnaK
MSKTINIGIDLGTTNSSIGIFNEGEVEIFKNPIGWKDTMPSVVSFKKDRIIIGQKAKESALKGNTDTNSLFKRKMGTSETFKIKSLDKSVSPVELSSYILKELKTFILKDDIDVSSAVITIPASFDTIQSNATKEAGKKAGFSDVVLLQEPIAASLAYANSKSRDLENTKWMVYDFGGGTFDVALLDVSNGEMNVIDHEGDNYLGGSDFDRLIVEEIIVPYLEKEYKFHELKEELQNRKSKYYKLYLKLLAKAEEAKIELTSQSSTEIEVEGEDEDGVSFDEEIIITKEEFEKLIKKHVSKTADMIKTIMARNSILNSDIDFILMIGGTTYIPFIKKHINEVLKIDVSNDIDPTTAVTVGASYYAGTKKKSSEKEINLVKKNQKIKVKMAYEKSSQDDSEYLAAKIEGEVSSYNFRITRSDGGFDSGIKKLDSRISEDLPLVKDTYNFFTFVIFDEYNNEIQSESIEISQGKYSITGQPLPEDICLEVDDASMKNTKLELIFKRNSILPIKKTITKDINKIISKDSNDELVINILEGNGNSIPSANKTLGHIKILGSDLNRNILRGSDIELTFEMTESRDFTVSAYISMIDQEFKETFNPEYRTVNINELSYEVDSLTDDINSSIEIAKDSNDYEKLDNLYSIQLEMDKLQKEVDTVDEDNTTDKRYQMEDSKRSLAQSYYNVIKDEKISLLKKEYREVKEKVEVLVSQYGDYSAQEIFKSLIEKEKAYLETSNYSKFEEILEEMKTLEYKMRWKNPEFVISAFKWVSESDENFTDQSRANVLSGKGLKAFQKNDIEELSDITLELISLLPKEERSKANNKIGFY